MQVRLYRPFPAPGPCWTPCPPSVRSIAVLDRTKEPGSIGEPLYLDVVAALDRGRTPTASGPMPRVMRRALRPVLEGVHARRWSPGCSPSFRRDRPRRRFTIGINDDVSGTSLTYDPALDIEAPDTVRAVFFGLGSDGTVGANKNTIKILGAEADLHAQGYFVYDSKKSGSQTVSHLRFGPRPDPCRRTWSARPASSAATSSACSIRSTCSAAPPGAPRCCSTAATRRTRCGTRCPGRCRSRSSPRDIEVYTIDAGRLAREAGLAGRTNTVLQTCFFAISGVLAPERGDRPDQGVDRQDLQPARR